MTWRELCRGVSLEFGKTRLKGSLEHIPSKNALVLYFEHGDAEVLSVDLLALGHVPRPDEVFVRDYSEHAGLPAALVRTGCFEHVEEVPLGSFGASAVRLRVRPQDELTAAALEAELTIRAAPDGSDAVLVREAATGHALRIHRDDADPEHRLVAYRVAAGWFGNLPDRTPWPWEEPGKKRRDPRGASANAPALRGSLLLGVGTSSQASRQRPTGSLLPTP